MRTLPRVALASVVAAGMALAVASASLPAHAAREDRGARERLKHHQEAQAHLRNGVDLMGQGAFEDAIAELRASEQIEPSGEVTEHIAECQEALGQIEKAAETYQQYLDETGSPPDAEAVKKHVRALEAQVHAEKGRAHVAAHRYDDALRELDAAQRAKPDPRIWYEMANLREEKGDNGQAIELYRRYLREMPDPPDAGEVEGRIRILSGQHIAAPQTPPPVAPPPERRPFYTSPIGVPLVVLGALALGGGAAAFGVASSARSDADGASREHDFLAHQETSFTAGKVGIAAVSVGAALVIGGVIAMYFHTRPREVVLPPAKKSFVPTASFRSRAPLRLPLVPPVAATSGSVSE